MRSFHFVRIFCPSFRARERGRAVHKICSSNEDSDNLLGNGLVPEMAEREKCQISLALKMRNCNLLLNPQTRHNTQKGGWNYDNRRSINGLEVPQGT